MLKETIKKEWYIIILLIVPFGASAYLWNDLPDVVPTHFNPDYSIENNKHK